MHRIVHIVGARPNFMKAAPVIASLSARDGMQQMLVHTGQHYDQKMSDIFFQQLGLPQPDLNLEVGSGSHAVQTGQIMIRFEEVAQDVRPDLVLVYGDVNSTVAAALVCAKLNISVGHVEAGLRSFDRTMPEEINRLLTDQIADLLLTPSADGNENLIREGVAPEKIHLVGNVMIDTLVRLSPAALERWERGQVAERRDDAYALVTLHRPSNVDDEEMLQEIVQTLIAIGQRVPVIFPVHPRTRQRLSKLDAPGIERLNLIEPIGYLDFLALQHHASVVITDSGGIQEETTFLGVPCLTVRENTERPITVSLGTNTLVGRDMQRLRSEADRVLDGYVRPHELPPLWDGKASERIADIVVDYVR